MESRGQPTRASLKIMSKEICELTGGLKIGQLFIQKFQAIIEEQAH